MIDYNNVDNKLLAYPVSFAQRRMWFLSKLEKNNFTFTIGGLGELKEDINLHYINKALQLLVNRHESLRTNFIETKNGEPVQYVYLNKEIKLNVLNINVGESEKKKIIKKLIDEPFNLETDILIRATLIINNGKKTFLVTIHHIISESWSLLLFLKEFFILYNSIEKAERSPENNLPPLTVQYKDFSTWEQSEEGFKIHSKQEKYWLNKFSGNLPVLDLPIDRPRPQVQIYKTKIQKLSIEKELNNSYDEFCHKNNITSFVFLLGIYFVFLNKISNQNDIIVGTFASNRDLLELDNVIGLFLNNIALRIKIDDEMSFAEFLYDVKHLVFEAMENKDYPFEKLIEKINPTRDTSRSPIFNVVFQTFNKNEKLKNEYFGENFKKDMIFDNGLSQFDLILKVFTEKDKSDLILSYNSYLFNEDTAKRFLKYYKTLLKNILKGNNLKISELEIIPKRERNLLINEFNATKSKLKEKLICDVFSKVASLDADKIGIICEERKITYVEIEEKVNALAKHLNNKGIKRGDVVGIELSRGENFIISILAILKAGAIYLPLDISLPENRLKYILEDSLCKNLIYEGRRVINFFRFEKCIDFSEIKQNVNTGNYPESISSDIANIFYTSGSTGEPKGIKIAQKALLNFSRSMQEIFEKSTLERILSLTSMSFDISFLENICPLLYGLTVVVASEKEKKDPYLVIDLIVKSNIDIIQITPSGIEELYLIDPKLTFLSSVKKLLVGGETLSDDLFKKIRNNFSGEIFNMYGPTETTIWSLMKKFGSSNEVTIGTPIKNTQAYIFDKNFKLCPIGVAGELYISGDGLAITYTKDKDNKVFLDHPFIENKRIYRTGDLAKIKPNGEILYLGRLDKQVKINGRRLELMEIQNLILKFAGIKQCFVNISGGQKDKKITAYYVCEDGITNKMLCEYLEKYLPEYMIPVYFIRLKEFPLTSSGKIDILAFPEANERYLIKSNFQSPLTEIEKELAKIWCDILGIKIVSRDDNFFKLGGHSLQLVTLFSRIENLFPDRVSIAELFTYSSISSLAEFIKKKGQEAEVVKVVDYKFEAEKLLDQVQSGQKTIDQAIKYFSKI